jgi:hypothetical protein
MEKETQKLDSMKGINPFRVPEGYMEDLASLIMSRLPEEQPHVELKRITITDHIRPWLYLAAVFVGLGLFINLLVGKGDSGNNIAGDSLLVQTTISQEAFYSIQEENDADYLEFIESQYVGYILAEEMGDYE